jgi:hypothetical protein
VLTGKKPTSTLASLRFSKQQVSVILFFNSSMEDTHNLLEGMAERYIPFILEL